MTAISSSRQRAVTGDAPPAPNRRRRATAHPISERVGMKRTAAPIGGVEKSPTIVALFALAQNHRLDVFQIVVQGGDQGVPAGQIRKRLGLRKSLISFHLKQLRLAGLVTLRREGRSFIYTAQDFAVNRLMSYLADSCSQAGPMACMGAAAPNS